MRTDPGKTNRRIAIDQDVHRLIRPGAGARALHRPAANSWHRQAGHRTGKQRLGLPGELRRRRHDRPRTRPGSREISSPCSRIVRIARSLTPPARSCQRAARPFWCPAIDAARVFLRPLNDHTGSHASSTRTARGRSPTADDTELPRGPPGATAWEPVVADRGDRGDRVWDGTSRPRIPHQPRPNPSSMQSFFRVGTALSRSRRGAPSGPSRPRACRRRTSGYPSTTIAAPPRRGSPPPQNAPPASRSTACTPPKNRLSSRNRASPRPSPSIPSTATPGSA